MYKQCSQGYIQFPLRWFQTKCNSFIPLQFVFASGTSTIFGIWVQLQPPEYTFEYIQNRVYSYIVLFWCFPLLVLVDSQTRQLYLCFLHQQLLLVIYVFGVTALFVIHGAFSFEVCFSMTSFFKISDITHINDMVQIFEMILQT